MSAMIVDRNNVRGTNWTAVFHTPPGSHGEIGIVVVRTETAQRRVGSWRRNWPEVAAELLHELEMLNLNARANVVSATVCAEIRAMFVAAFPDYSQPIEPLDLDATG